MLEKIGYVLLSLVALLWIIAIFTGLIAALPYGLVGLVGLVGIGALLIKVLKDRLGNSEDDYYSKNVEK